MKTLIATIFSAMILTATPASAVDWNIYGKAENCLSLVGSIYARTMFWQDIKNDCHAKVKIWYTYRYTSYDSSQSSKKGWTYIDPESKEDAMLGVVNTSSSSSSNFRITRACYSGSGPSTGDRSAFASWDMAIQGGNPDPCN